MECRFKVTSESDGRDCDGPITHGQEIREMNYSELAQLMGFALLRHGSCYPQDCGEGVTTFVFSHKHDEGFSRTCITFEEVES